MAKFDVTNPTIQAAAITAAAQLAIIKYPGGPAPMNVATLAEQILASLGRSAEAAAANTPPMKAGQAL